MTHFAVSMGLVDGRCAVTGHTTPVPIVVEVEGDLVFPEAHLAANRLAAEITGLDLDGKDSPVKRLTTQPFTYDLEHKLARRSVA